MNKNTLKIPLALVLLIACAAGAWFIIEIDETPSPPPKKSPTAIDHFTGITGQWHSGDNKDQLKVQDDQTGSFKLGDYESSGSITYRKKKAIYTIKFDHKNIAHVCMIKTTNKEGNKIKGNKILALIYKPGDKKEEAKPTPVYKAVLTK